MASEAGAIASLAIILCCDVATITEKAQENSWNGDSIPVRNGKYQKFTRKYKMN